MAGAPWGHSYNIFIRARLAGCCVGNLFNGHINGDYLLGTHAHKQ